VHNSTPVWLDSNGNAYSLRSDTSCAALLPALRCVLCALCCVLPQAFDAAGRQPGAFIAQAVVDVAAMLQEGSLNASAALVNRRGEAVTPQPHIHANKQS
jgi:hypothetical protein